MSRLYTCGFELGSLTNGMEWFITESAALSTTTVRTGSYSLRINGLTSGSAKCIKALISDTNSAAFYARTYLNIATLPSAENTIIMLSTGSTSSTGTKVPYLTLDSGGLLRLYDEAGQIGSASAALSTGTWYCIELCGIRNTGSSDSVIRARIDESEFAGATNRSISVVNYNYFYVGGNLKQEAQTTGDWFFDDLAANNTGGTVQNSWPGSGRVAYLWPDGDGDTNNSSGDYTAVDESPTPDGATTTVTLANTNDIMDVTLESPSSKGISGTITLVAPMARHAGANATSSYSLQSRIKSASGGTVSGSNFASFTSTSYATSNTHKHFVNGVSYTDPDTSLPWTVSGTNSLENAQIGVKVSDADPDVLITALWAIVEYVDPVNGFSSSWLNFG